MRFEVSEIKINISIVDNDQYAVTFCDRVTYEIFKITTKNSHIFTIAKNWYQLYQKTELLCYL